MDVDPRRVSPEEPEYEAPQVERVLDADELGREVLYAGRDDGGTGVLIST